MALRVSEEEFASFLRKQGKSLPLPLVPPPAKPSKYRNQPIVINGLRFDSKGEAQRWQELNLMLKAGLITDLKRQVTFPIIINGHTICSYRADFVYLSEGVRVVEDFKGVATEVYSLKKSLLYAVHGIEIKEVRKRH